MIKFIKLLLKPSLLLCIALYFAFTATCFAFDHTYTAYDKLLQQAVVMQHDGSSINYALLQQKKFTSKINLLVDTIQAVKRSEFNTWTQEQQLAFLMNAYNLLTIKLILTKYPSIKSIKDIGSLFSSPWKKRFFLLFNKKQNLDYIEHTLIRKRYQEPRIHFALVCASISCPGLWNHAFKAATLDKDLTTRTKAFLRNTSKNRILTSKKTLKISRIFKWYAGDFTKKYKTVQTFISLYITDDPQVQKAIVNYKLDYFDYNWGLNTLSRS